MEALREWEPVQLAYISSPPAPGPAQPAGTNPEYGGANGLKQKYLLDGPTGISALFAWDQPGGTGAGVQFIDIEKGWVLNHADLLDQNGVPRVNLLSGVNLSEQAHGTNVLGILVAQDNQIGCVGIARDAIGSVVSAFRPLSGDNGVVWNIACAIKDATNRLKPGDVILLEVQVWRDGVLAPAELEKAIFDEIELATNLGITVIEAAANGNQHLANFVNDEQPGLHILDQARADYADSGAIMVAPQPILTTTWPVIPAILTQIMVTGWTVMPGDGRSKQRIMILLITLAIWINIPQHLVRHPRPRPLLPVWLFWCRA
ncbi:MAG: hypothetical protein IPL78_14010 [Chloroflexi bacterium]|nr:hypothetical protein [Chloroflexota bacterium]